MGVAISEILVKKEIEFSDLVNKVIAVDAPLFLYQFLTTIRSGDGTPLTDSKGNITSHLIGLFFRTSTLIKNNLKLVFVFDGKSPELKNKERERRRKLKQQAQKEYEIAKEREDVEAMEKYAKRTSRLDKDMINDSIELLEALGLPVIRAPSEAEAQASYMVKKGDAFAVATQDLDTLMFGATRILKNLSIAGKRKRSRKQAFDTYKPELLIQADNMNNLGIDLDRFIVLCMLVGTDFNIGGVKGLGPKKALALVKEKGNDFEVLFKSAKWNDFFDFSWKVVFDLIKNMPVTDDYNLEWNRIDTDRVKKLLVEKHDFNEDRVETTLKRIKKEAGQQKGLNEFF